MKSYCFRTWEEANKFTLLLRAMAFGTDAQVLLEADSKGRPTVLTDATDQNVEDAIELLHEVDIYPRIKCLWD